MTSFSLVVASALLCVALTCSPEGYIEIHMGEMAKIAPIIAYGLVTDMYPHSEYEMAYSAEFEVKCTYKGDPLPSRINISDLGYIPGMCGYKNFTVGIEYIAFLENYDGIYSQKYDETKEASKSMNKLLTYCGLTMKYPSDGLNETKCRKPVQRGCIPLPEKPFRPRPPPIYWKTERPVFAGPDGSGETEGIDFTSDMETETGSFSSSKIETETKSHIMTSSETEVTSTKTEVTSTGAEVTSTGAEVTTTKTEVTSTKTEVTSTKTEVTSTGAEVTTTKVVGMQTTSEEAKENAPLSDTKTAYDNSANSGAGSRFTTAITTPTCVLILFWIFSQ